MTDTPILFTGAMIQALLAGRKTQTRRILTPHNTLFNGGPWIKRFREQEWNYAEAWVDKGLSPAGNPGPYLHVPWLAGDDDFEETVHRIYPSVQPEDFLWAKETWRPLAGFSNWDLHIYYHADQTMMHFADDGSIRSDWNWPKSAKRGLVPSIFMPKWASRLKLDVTNVRIERLQDISEADAIAEGFKALSKDGKLIKWGIPDRDGLPGGDNFGWHWRDWNSDPRQAYRHLWDSINGKNGICWATNPWVLAYTFDVYLRQTSTEWQLIEPTVANDPAAQNKIAQGGE
jgi:hypothetical protein